MVFFLLHLVMDKLLDSNLIIIDSKCSICTEPMLASVDKDDATTKDDSFILVKLPQCVHCFHRSCIKQWFESCRKKLRPLSCPVCRQQLASGEVASLKKRPREYATLEEAKAVYKRMCRYDRDQMSFYAAGKFAKSVFPGGKSDDDDSSSDDSSSSSGEGDVDGEDARLGYGWGLSDVDGEGAGASLRDGWGSS
jgi:hypothetical protein